MDEVFGRNKALELLGVSCRLGYT